MTLKGSQFVGRLPFSLLHNGVVLGIQPVQGTAAGRKIFDDMEQCQISLDALYHGTDIRAYPDSTF
jgi:hypothetical protein